MCDASASCLCFWPACCCFMQAAAAVEVTDSPQRIQAAKKKHAKKGWEWERMAGRQIGTVGCFQPSMG